MFSTRNLTHPAVLNPLKSKFSFPLPTVLFLRVTNSGCLPSTFARFQTKLMLVDFFMKVGVQAARSECKVGSFFVHSINYIMQFLMHIHIRIAHASVQVLTCFYLKNRSDCLREGCYRNIYVNNRSECLREGCYRQIYVNNRSDCLREGCYRKIYVNNRSDCLLEGCYSQIYVNRSDCLRKRCYRQIYVNNRIDCLREGCYRQVYVNNRSDCLCEGFTVRFMLTI